ncbi:ABC transporter substrate-binding protein [Roseivivax sp.]
MTLLRYALAAFLALIAVPATAQEDIAEFGTGATEMTLMSTTDIAIIAPVMQRFADLNPDLLLRYEQWGSNALFARSRAACEDGGQGAPADAILSSAVHHMVWLVNAACAHRYVSPRTSALPPVRRWRDEVWGLTEEPAVIIYNKRALGGAEVPRSRFALLDLMREAPEALRGRIATYDIAASGLGYLFAHSDSLEASTFGAMLEGFARVDAVATCCSTEIIRGVAEGQYDFAYNVLGSYVASVAEPDVGVILPEDYTLILSRSYMIPHGARQKEGATRLLDFLLSAEAQGMLAEIGLVMSADADEHGLVPSARRLIALSPSLLVALDANTREGLFSIWNNAFSLGGSP